MNGWIEATWNLLAEGQPIVLVTVAGVRGSSPREVGARMIVTPTETLGTIGGGQLEYRCTRIACGILGEGSTAKLMKFPLGASMGQCCGGVVDVLFEPMTRDSFGWLQDLRGLNDRHEPAVICTDLRAMAHKGVVTENRVFGPGRELPREIVARAHRQLATPQAARRHGRWLLLPVAPSGFNVALFGAGHVGTAVVRSLRRLDCNIRWIDSREKIFRRPLRNVRTVESSNPSVEVAAMPPESFFLVMTHSHALDFEITDQILRRGDAAYCGLIGSRSKRRRFEKRFREQGMPHSVMDRLVCPIGVSRHHGKEA